MARHHVRFAPSPTGDLHLGHVYSALYAWQSAGQNPDNFQLRIDDLDYNRCKPHFILQHMADLAWLGISWRKEPLYQSKRLHRYQDALAFLADRGWAYECFLTRREVDEILSAPQQTASLKEALSPDQAQQRRQDGQEPAWRLDMAKIKGTVPTLNWFDKKKGARIIDLNKLDDVIIARRDIGASYHLSVILDDFDSGISLVTRGEDLYEQTDIHRLLQHLLALPTPLYDHHILICDDDGKRLAKRDDARSLASLRAQGYCLADIMARLPL